MGDPNRTSLSSVTSSAEQDYIKKVLRDLKLLISASVQENDAMDENDDGDVTDTEWFFLISMPQSFVDGKGLPGQALFSNQPVWIVGREQLSVSHCERAQQGQGFGLQTIVCIPTRGGVVELGSTELILQISNLLNQVRLLFELNNSQPDLTPMNEGQTAGGDSDPSKAICNTTAIPLSQEVVDEQFEKNNERSSEISLFQELVDEQLEKIIMKKAVKSKTMQSHYFKNWLLKSKMMRSHYFQNWLTNSLKKTMKEAMVDKQFETNNERSGEIQDDAISLFPELFDEQFETNNERSSKIQGDAISLFPELFGEQFETNNERSSKIQDNAISLSQELVDKQLEKHHERSCEMRDTEISLSQEVVEKHYERSCEMQH